MAFHVNHIHLKSFNPRQTADWYIAAFNLKLMSDTVRPEPLGDQMVRCETEDGAIALVVSGPRTGETLGPGDANPHIGLEHFGFEVVDLETEVARLTGLGAVLLEGPLTMPSGSRVAFIRAPDDVRIELIQPAAAS